MDTAVYLLLYITTFVTSTWFSIIAASTDTGTPNVPTEHSPGHFTSGRDTPYDVTSLTPKDIFQSEIWSLHVQTTDLPSDVVSENSDEPLVHTVVLAHTSATDSEEEHRTVPFAEGALARLTTANVGRTFESSSAASLTELRNVHGDEFHTALSLATEQTTLTENSEQHYETTLSSEHTTSFRNSTSAGRRKAGTSSTSSEDSKASSGESNESDLEDERAHQNEIPEAPVHRERNDGLMTEANINHAALWITVAFVAVLLVYITVLIIYNAKKRDWHQSLPPYTRFMEETTPEEQERTSTLDKMLQRITGKRNIEDGYSLSF